MRIELAILPNLTGEMDELVHEYYDKLDADPELPPLDMNWDLYVHLWEKEHLLSVAAQDERLQGFVMYHVSYHPHYQRVLFAQCDIIAVRKTARGRGIGRRMMAYAEPLLKSMDVKVVLHNFRSCYGETPLFPKVGYRLFEHNFIKVLS